MLTPRVLPALLALLLLPVVTSCGGSATGVPAPIIPDEEEKDGAVKCDPAVYPCGPYGYAPGSVLKNLKLVGRRDDNRNGDPTDDETREITLSQYYADKNVKVLVLLASAEWCEPCRIEQPGLVQMFKEYEYAGKGVALLEAMIQDTERNPADMAVADRWAKEFSIPFDMAVDPAGQLSPYFDINAFPMQMVVRTRDMSIVWQANGVQERELREMIDRVLTD